MPSSKRKTTSRRKRTASSTIWLQRRERDKYVVMSNTYKYRARSAFKLLEIEQKFGILKQLHSRADKYTQSIPVVIDLGCAPGGWLQVIKSCTKPETILIGVDICEVNPLDGVTLIRGDFCLEQTIKMIRENIANTCTSSNNILGADVLLSDMAPQACGDKCTDHIRIMHLAQQATLFAKQILLLGGSFVIKLWNGNSVPLLVKELKTFFKKVEYFHPNATYRDSSEVFLVARDRFI